MSVYNRKMFKPRNARNALNRAAGIPSVQKFQQGGPVQPNIFQRFMNAPDTFSGIANALRGTTVPTTNPARQPNTQFTLTPGIAAGVAKDIQPDALRRAQVDATKKGIFGSSGILDALSVKGGLSGTVDRSTSQTEAERIAQLAKLGGAQVYDAGAAALQAPLMLGFDLGTGLAASADQITPEFARDVASGKSQLTPQLIAGINSGLVKVPPILAKAIDDGAVDVPGLDITRVQAKQLPAAVQIMKELPGAQTIKVGEEGAGNKGLPETAAERMARIAIEDAGMTTDMDPNEALMQQIAMDDAGMTTDMSAEEQEAAGGDILAGSRYDAGTPEGAFPDDSQTDADAAAAARTDTDPNAGASITAPKPKPENFAEIVAQAKAANAKDGIPPLTSTQQEVDVASQKGTGSPEDIKAEFLKLLPKYEEDPSIQGLNIAMMGFAIAGGESSSAMKNIADGMKKTLPAFIKSKEKRKAFERETDLLASKYAIQRKEADRTRGLTEKDYFVKTAFTSPDGRNFEVGQPVSLSSDAFKLMEQQGLTGNLTTSAIFLEEAKERTKNAQGLGYKEINALYKNETREFGGVKYDILVPTPYGIKNGATSTVLASENDLPVLTNAYVTNLDKINSLDLGVQEARGLVATGEATGGKAVIGNLFDGLRGAGMNGTLKSIGFNPPEELSTAGQYAKVHGILAMQLAPILLGESGKTISDVDRVRVATALGYKAELDKNGNAIINLSGGPATLFQSQQQADAALVEVQKILRNRAKEEHAKYRGVMTSIGQKFEERKVDENTQSALTQGLGRDLIDTGKKNDQGMPIYKLPPIGE